MKKINIISLRVIALFAIAMLVSFIPELVPDFFGDWMCKGRECIAPVKDGFIGSYLGCDYAALPEHNPTNHWGYRHWLFFAMGVSLFIIQIVDIINYNFKEDDKI